MKKTSSRERKEFSNMGGLANTLSSERCDGCRKSEVSILNVAANSDQKEMEQNQKSSTPDPPNLVTSSRQKCYVNECISCGTEERANFSDG